MGGGSKSVTVGYQYYLGCHMIICKGPVDEVQKIYVQNKVVWNGVPPADPPASASRQIFAAIFGKDREQKAGLITSGPAVTSSQQIYIKAPNIFGGIKKEGGIQGLVDVMFGEQTQTMNDYLAAKIGGVLPAYRGVLSLVLRKVYMCAINPYPKPWSVTVKRIPGKTWYPSKADINGGANPIHIIYEVLTSDYALNYPASDIDDTSFKAAADTCYAEGLGTSILLSAQDQIDNFIYVILGYCNGMINVDPSTGKFTIKLLRNDYTVGSLKSFSPSNVVRLNSFEIPAYGDLVNEITCKYRLQGAIEDSTLTVNNLASIQAQGRIISQTVNYQGADTTAMASKLAQRDLKQKSTPLTKINITVNRYAWDLSLGDTFKLTWPDRNVTDMVFRVMRIDKGTRTSGTINIDALEDVFAMPTYAIHGTQPTVWVNPDQPPSDFPTRRIEEATYWDVAYSTDPANFANLSSTACFMVPLMAEPNYLVDSYDLWSTPASGTYTFAETSEPVANGITTAIATPLTTAITLNNLSSRCEFVELHTYAYWENEIVRVDAFDPDTGAVTIARGCLDTVPVAHAAGTLFLFAEKAATSDPTQYVTGEVVWSKALPRTPTALLPLSSATQNTYTMKGRFNKPWAPGLFKINSASYQSVTVNGLSLSWTHRDRTQQVVTPIYSTIDGDIGPEAGVTYRVDIYASDGTTLMKSVSSISPNNWSWGSTEAAENVNSLSRNRIKVTAVRGGIDSHQSHDWFVDRAGYGYNYGNYYGGV